MTSPLVMLVVMMMLVLLLRLSVGRCVWEGRDEGKLSPFCEACLYRSGCCQVVLSSFPLSCCVSYSSCGDASSQQLEGCVCVCVTVRGGGRAGSSLYIPIRTGRSVLVFPPLHLARWWRGGGGGGGGGGRAVTLITE